jgi:geranylgeranyl reductase family protein
MAVAAPDVLVVGLGPAGSRAAAAAAAAGLAVVALERKERAGTPVQCAEFVPAMLDQELAGLGAVTAQTIRRMLTFVEGAPADETANFNGRMIDRATFDAALAEAAAAAGADCRYGSGLRGIAADGTVTASDGARFRPRVLIGADGPASRVGRAIGQVNRETVETRQVTVPLEAGHDATDIFLRADIVGGYGWLFPKGAVANLGLGLAPAFRARLKPLLAALHAELVAAGRVGREVLGRTGGPIPVGGRLKPCGRLGDSLVLLAGDAAGLANPVTGAGIAAAVQSGALAGQAAARHCAGVHDAAAGYDDELGDLYDVSLGRALRRRRELLAALARPAAARAAALRRGWIAYDDYWAA